MREAKKTKEKPKIEHNADGNPRDESPMNNQTSSIELIDAMTGGSAAAAPAAAPPLKLPSTLSDEEMNELFNVFLDDSISGDTLFEIPVNFEEIVEESFERLSQEAEKKVAGVIKRIINMEEEQKVGRQHL